MRNTGYCLRAGTTQAAAMMRTVTAVLIVVSWWGAGMSAGQEKAENPPVDDDILFTVKPAPKWDTLFDRTAGWTGADGVFSIPLSGSERREQGENARTLIVFGDTFIGKVNPENDHRLAGTTMINGTIAILKGDEPIAKNISFRYHHDENDKSQSIVIPDTPSAKAGQWYWFEDGIVIDDKVYVFASRMMRKGTGGAFDFMIDGVVLLQTNANHPFAEKPLQTEMPILSRKNETRGEISFGNAIFANTKEAGAPDPDGYIYIYGAESVIFNKKLVAARVKPTHIKNIDQWKFYNGAEWSGQIADAAGLTDRISMSFSVSPISDGRYILVFQENGMGRNVAVRIGKSPVGPWGPVREIYCCPEVIDGITVFNYNAKAHPHLSKPGELLISYNVNSGDFWSHFKHADIYRPRFIRLILRNK